MITLYTFGPYFGLPDASPFVVKAMLLLKWAGLDYRVDTSGFRKAPKSKLPYINDNGQIVADSTFIRFHIEERHGHDFDQGLSPRDKAIGWAVEKMCEDHLYWAMIDVRWGHQANFDRGPRTFFDIAPGPLRPIIAKIVRRKALGSARAHGMGLHSRAEIERLAVEDIAAISNILGDKPYLMGDRPCAADASVFALLTGIFTPVFETPIRDAAAEFPNLAAYCERISREYFPGA